MSYNDISPDDISQEHPILTAAIIAIYSQVLRLYPRRFRAEYSGEMQAVFAQALAAASPHQRLRLCLRELRDLPPSIVRAYFHERRTMKTLFHFDKQQEIRIVRWMIRVVSLLICLFFISTFGMLSSRLQLPASAIPLYVLFILTTLSLLVAWRWEVTGGRLTMILALLLGLSGAYATYSYGATLPNLWSGTHIFASALALIEWALPFLIFGWLFVKVGRQTVEKPA